MAASFCFSLDAELAWGIQDYPDRHAYVEKLHHARKGYDQLCELFDRHQIPVTWAFVVRMLEARPQTVADVAHADELPEFAKDLIRSGQADLLFAPDLIDRVRQTAVRHEIAAHGYAHISYRHSAEAELRRDATRACAGAQRAGIPLTSFVFPYNHQGQHQILRDAGFTCFRGDAVESPSRIGRLYEQTFAAAPVVQRPVQHESGLWNVPASMFLMPLAGFLRSIGGRRSRRERVRRGIARAIQENTVFHLWAHPHNFFGDGGAMIGCLQEVLEVVVDARNCGDLECQTMATIAARCERPDESAHDQY